MLASSKKFSISYDRFSLEEYERSSFQNELHCILRKYIGMVLDQRDVIRQQIAYDIINIFKKYQVNADINIGTHRGYERGVKIECEPHNQRSQYYLTDIDKPDEELI